MEDDIPYTRLWTLGDESNDRLCFFDKVPKGLERYDFRLRFGDPVSGVYPADAKLFMERQNPGVKLSSFIGNTKGMIVAARELREAVEKHCAGVAIEHLPVTIIDHKKRPYSTDSCIVNPLGTCNCADREASDITYGDGRKVVLRVNRLVLSSKKVKDAPQLFRLDLWPSTYIVGPSLADEIRARKLTNVVLHDLKDK